MTKRRLGLALYFLVAGGLLVPAPSPAKEPVAEAARLTFRAVDSTGRPVGGARVRVAAEPEALEKRHVLDEVWTKTTSDQGRARFAALPAERRLWCLVERPGLVPVARSAILQPGEQRTFRVVLRPGGMSTGRVVDEAGRPVAGAEVRLRIEAFGRHLPFGNDFQYARSDDRGLFRYRDLPEGDLHIRIDHPSYLFEEYRPALRRSRDLGTFELRRGPTLTGRVTDPQGHPVSGLSLWTAPFDHGEHPYLSDVPDATTGPDGSFSIPNRPEPAYRIYVCGPGHVAEPAIVWATDRPVELTVRPAGTVHGRVLDPEGRPLAGAAVQALQVQPFFPPKAVFSPCPRVTWQTREDYTYFGPGEARALTDAEGRFSAGPLQGGWYDLLVRAPGAAADVYRLRVEPGQALTGVEIETQPQARTVPAAKRRVFTKTPQPRELPILRGRVVGPRGSPIADVLITGFYDETWSARDGSFELPHPRDIPEIQVTKPGFATARMDLKPGSAPVEIRLQTGTVVEGRVRGLSAADRDRVSLSFYPDNGDPYEATVQPDGSFRIDRVPAGSLWAVLRAGPRKLETSIDLEPGQARAWLDLELPAWSSVSGRVLDPLGHPVARAKVSVEKDVQWRTTETRADGSFSLLLPEGRVRMSVEHEDFHEEIRNVEIAGSGVEGMEFRLDPLPAATLHGRLLGLAPGEWATVRVNAVGERDTGRPAEVELDRYRLRHLGAGLWEIEVWVKGAVTDRQLFQAIEVKPDRTDVELDLVLPPPRELRP